MTIAIMQPYLFPYIGYWQLINAVDKFIILDDVNYINKGWINRNEISCGRFTLPLINASQNRPISEHDIFGDWSFVDKVVQCYKSAPYFEQAASIIFRPVSNKLTDYLYSTIKMVCGYLGISTSIVESSSIYGKNGKGTERILDICRQEGASRYINPINGQVLYNDDTFKQSGIELKFLRTLSVNKFSIIDWMMNKSVNEIRTELNNYELL